MRADMKVEIVCLKWGTKYSSSYVNKLYNMVKRNLDLDFEFCCLTDDATGLSSNIKVVPISDDSDRGWWYKMHFFNAQLFPKGHIIIYLDLDIVIVGKINFLLERSHILTVAPGFKNPKLINSSIMVFESGTLHFLYEEYKLNRSVIVSKYRGDQDWIFVQAQPFLGTFDRDKVISFKAHCHSLAFPYINRVLKPGLRIPAMSSQASRLPTPEAAIVCFHGKPDPEDVQFGPYREWKRADFVDKYWC